MTSVVSEVMGDPAARHHAISDVLDARARAETDEARQIAAVREQFRQEKKTGPRGPVGPRTNRLAPELPGQPVDPPVRNWIPPWPRVKALPTVAIAATGELQFRMSARRCIAPDIIGKGQVVVRVAVEPGALWIERCTKSDDAARVIGQDGYLRGGPFKDELLAAGFEVGASYEIRHDTGRTFVARMERRIKGAKPNG